VTQVAIVLVAVGSALLGAALLGAFVSNELWRRAFRVHMARWRAHCERLEQETGDSLRRMSEVARNACDLNARYAAYLADKIIITDPRTRRRDRPTA